MPRLPILKRRDAMVVILPPALADRELTRAAERVLGSPDAQRARAAIVDATGDDALVPVAEPRRAA